MRKSCNKDVFKTTAYSKKPKAICLSIGRKAGADTIALHWDSSLLMRPLALHSSDRMFHLPLHMVMGASSNGSGLKAVQNDAYPASELFKRSAFNVVTISVSSAECGPVLGPTPFGC